MTELTLTPTSAKPVSSLLGKRWVRGLTGVIALLVLLELASRSGLIPVTMLPPVSAILSDTLGLLTTPAFLSDVVSTLTSWAIGLGLAILIAVPLGLFAGSFRLLYEASRAVVDFLRPIPSVALIPLAILVFGQGTSMKVALVIYAAIWPIFFNTLYGARDIDPIAKETGRTFRISSLGIVGRILLPHSAPFAFTGIRISASIALIVTISAELLSGSPDGIGAYILRISSGGGETSQVFAGTIIAGVLGIVMNALLVQAEKRMFRWKQERGY